MSQEKERREGGREIRILTTLKSLFRRCLHCLLVVASSSYTSRDTPRGDCAGIPGLKEKRTETTITQRHSCIRTAVSFLERCPSFSGGGFLKVTETGEGDKHVRATRLDLKGWARRNDNREEDQLISGGSQA